MTVVHIVPVAVFSNNYHGSYKDTISRVRYFETNHLPYQQIRLDADDPVQVFRQLESVTSYSFLVEYSTFPKVVQKLRQQFPNAFIAVRSHNLEPLQHLDNHGWWPRRKGLPWMLYGMGRLFAGDLIVKKYASTIWSISDWESRVYWDHLPGRAKVEWLPYHCPDHLLPESISPSNQRNRIACLPTSQKNRKSWDLVTRFIAFAEQMKRLTGDQYEFTITGQLADWGLPQSSAVTYTGMIADLNGYLQTVRAVAMLSDKGYGFKTSIGDAIAHGALVLAHPKLARRCPAVLRPAILALDVERFDLTSVQAALRESVSYEALNGAVRDQQKSILDSSFRPTPTTVLESMPIVPPIVV